MIFHFHFIFFCRLPTLMMPMFSLIRLFLLLISSSFSKPAVAAFHFMLRRAVFSFSFVIFLSSIFIFISFLHFLDFIFLRFLSAFHVWLSSRFLFRLIFSAELRFADDYRYAVGYFHFSCLFDDDLFLYFSMMMPPWWLSPFSDDDFLSLISPIFSWLFFFRLRFRWLFSLFRFHFIALPSWLFAVGIT